VGTLKSLEENPEILIKNVKNTQILNEKTIEALNNDGIIREKISLFNDFNIEYLKLISFKISAHLSGIFDIYSYKYIRKFI
jgi:hypothetical protein